MQSVKLIGLGSAIPLGQTQVGDVILAKAVADATINGPIGKIILPVCGAIKATICGLTGTGATVCGVIIVVVIGVLKAHSGVEFPGGVTLGAQLAVD